MSPRPESRFANGTELAAALRNVALLLGENPQTIPRGLTLIEQALPDVPPGLPLALLGLCSIPWSFNASEGDQAGTVIVGCPMQP